MNWPINYDDINLKGDRRYFYWSFVQGTSPQWVLENRRGHQGNRLILMAGASSFH